LPTTGAGTQNIILGSMFFQQFYVQYSNQYNQTQFTQGVVSIYVNSAMPAAYVGNEVLPTPGNGIPIQL